MKKLLIVAAAASVSFISPGLAQDTAPAAPEAQQAVPSIQNVSIVSRSVLPAESQAQIDGLVASRSEEQMQQLRSTLGAEPVVVQALEANGVSPDDVIVAQLTPQGALILVTE